MGAYWSLQGPIGINGMITVNLPACCKSSIATNFQAFNFSDTEHHNVDEVLREAINALKNDSRFLSITIQPESHDEKTPVMQPVRNF